VGVASARWSSAVLRPRVAPASRYGFSLPKTNWLWAVRAIPRHPYLSPCPDAGELQDDSSLRDRNPRASTTMGCQSDRVPTLTREIILLKAQRAEIGVGTLGTPEASVANKGPILASP